MYKSILIILVVFISIISCNSSRNLANIQPKSGIIEIPATGEFRIWNNVSHSNFEVLLTNDNEKQSCEIYLVKRNGKEKWISPSLLAKSNQTINIPTDGHLYLKNFNPNALTITYKIKE